MKDEAKDYTKKQHDLQQQPVIEEEVDDRFFVVENSVFQEDLSTLEKLILIVIYRHIGPGRFRFPAREELLKEFGCSQEQAIEAVRNIGAYFEAKQQALAAAEE